MKISLRQSPLVLLVLAFCGGIVLSSYLGFWSLLLLPLGLLGLIWMVANDRKLLHQCYDWWAIGAIACLFIGLGGLRQLATTIEKEGQPLEVYNCQRTTILGEVAGPIKRSEWGLKVPVAVIAVQADSQWQPVQGKCMAYFPRSFAESLSKYDTVCLGGNMQTLYSRYLSYQQYLYGQGLEHALQVKAWRIGGVRSGIQAGAYALQQRCAAQLEKLITDPQMIGLAQAMFVGEKRKLGYEQKQQFAAAGASHILAISGLHVGMIFCLLQWVFTPLLGLRHGKRLRSVIMLLVLLGYMMLTGAAPAVCRATLMLSLVLVYRFFRCRHHLLNVVATAALVQLLIDPELLWAVGFQLSYAAVVGIVLLMPLFEAKFTADAPLIAKVYGWIGISLIATLATAPLVWFYFGQFPTYFLLANILISVFASALVMMGFLTVILGWVPVVGELLGDVCTQLLRLLDIICLEISQLPYAVITEVDFNQPGWLILGVQLLLATVFLMLPQFPWRTWQRMLLRRHSAFTPQAV